MDMSLSICSDCLYLTNCSLRQKDVPVFECVEYKRISVEEFEDEIDANTFHTGFDKNSIPGLCGNCELFENCQWRSSDSIKFECEHYQ